MTMTERADHTETTANSSLSNPIRRCPLSFLVPPSSSFYLSSMLFFPELFLSFSSLSVMEERVSTEVAVPQMISLSKRQQIKMLDTIFEEEYYDLELIKPLCPRQFTDQLLVMFLTYHAIVRSSSY